MTQRKKKTPKKKTPVQRKKKNSVDDLLGETEREMICRISNLTVEEQYKERTIRAIVYLQHIVGVEESREKAEAGWRAMDYWERRGTLTTYMNFTKII